MSRHGSRSEAGVVLIVVLWGIVLLTLIAFALSTAMRTGVEGMESRKEQLQARYYARGAIYRTLGLLLAPPPSAPGENPPAGPPPAADWRGSDWRVNVQIDDEAGKLDLNHAPKEMLARLFQALGLKLDSAAALADATEAWRTPATSSGMQEDELDAYYQNLPQPYLPPHADFQSIGEMLLVRGVTPELYHGQYIARQDGGIERRPGLVDCLTVHSSGAAININSAPYPVLLAVPGMDPQIATAIVQARAQQPFASLNRLTDEFPATLDPETLSYLSTQDSGWFSLLATATMAGGVKARVRAVVELQPGKQPPFQILKWDDSYVR